MFAIRELPLSAVVLNGVDQVANKLVDDHLSFLPACTLHAVVKEDVAEHWKKISQDKYSKPLPFIVVKVLLIHIENVQGKFP